MEESLFTKIINGKIPSHVIYEDERVFAFLDIYPSQPGHALVVPKRQVEFMWDLEDEDYVAVMSAAKKIVLHMRGTLSVPYVGVKIVGVDIPHAHVHLIPFTTTEEYNTPQNTAIEPDHVALANMAEKLKL